jgi:uncharacterized phage-associated protein
MIIRNPIASDLASPNHVADFLLTDSRRKGDVVTNLKLQKLLYYAQASEWRPIQDDIRAPQSLPPKLAKHLFSIIATFGVETATALEMMTHQEGPWLRARRNVPHNAPSRALITKISMKDYYRHTA